MISVIIPSLNEAGLLPKTLAAVSANAGSFEVILVDAGSEDGTVDVARQVLPSIRVVLTSTKQRAWQLNLGARAVAPESTGLLFLHADTVIEPNAIRSISDALDGDSNIAGGCFVRTYDSDSGFLRRTCRMAAWRARKHGWFLGDQAMFVRRATYERMGGFELRDRFEDLDFALRLKAEGSTVVLEPAVQTSARRFQNNGPLVRTTRDFFLTLGFLLCRVLPIPCQSSIVRKPEFSTTNPPS